jgi:hypothetical protein
MVSGTKVVGIPPVLEMAGTHCKAAIMRKYEFATFVEILKLSMRNFGIKLYGSYFDVLTKLS